MRGNLPEELFFPLKIVLLAPVPDYQLPGINKNLLGQT
jgi:hypothetical protein